MKMPIVEVAITLAYLMSFVLATDQPSIMMASGMRGAQSHVVPVGNDQGNNAMTSEGSIIILISKSDREALAHIIGNTAGIISAASSGNTGALASNVVGLLGAVLPPTPTTPEPISEPGADASAPATTST
ncbi:hypothetical protein KRP22_005808 [Phytophthora ramorum]|uniref:uncharacterized protein n=1 Tax=Phytophthora ramorum TaxID=164328 RepID=UPI0030A549D7|nr:hypothetical protein KRP23_3702 [Phytophthora ramorum]KAH7507966.1 hypothetical protein KRP22_3060 [Phytophthora ramorum]